MQINPKYLEVAKAAAESVDTWMTPSLDGESDRPQVAIVLTSNLYSKIGWDEPFGERPLVQIPGFEGLSELSSDPNHQRMLRLSRDRFTHEKILVLDGRIHCYEQHGARFVLDMVRLQVEMLLALGVRKFVITSAVGTCTPTLGVGQIAVANGLLSFGHSFGLAIGPEFPVTDQALSPRLRQLALNKDETFMVRPATHFYVRGPDVETARIKSMIAQFGGHVVGMSGQPELSILSLWRTTQTAGHVDGDKIETLMLNYITNGDEHNGSSVAETVQRYGDRWMNHLGRVVPEITGRNA